MSTLIKDFLEYRKILLFISEYGQYLYLESSDTKDNHVARLNSTEIPATAGSSPRCFTFWYHMYGPDVNSLKIFTSVGGLAGDAIWSRTGSHGNQWRQGQVNTYARQKYQVSKLDCYLL